MRFGGFDVGRSACTAFTRPRAMGDAQLLAWVLMPDHVHWLIQLEHEPLARVVARMKAAVSRELHEAGLVDGPVWARAFQDRAIRRDEDLRAAARYIVANPLRAGLRTSLGMGPERNGDSRASAPTRRVSPGSRV
ncbi:transposase [Luteimonas sp. FCS-9]|uniref:REP-associated tyrosine transposase n=1 Tax=Luteimonas sp. FCS-9 TaxID=1547516 RepID=UPI0031B58CC0